MNRTMYNAIHVHTDGSALDGSCNIRKLVRRAKEMGMTAVGITDHGNMINSLVFQAECRKEGIKPVIGCEFYLGEPESKDKFHLLLIAKDNWGLKNLYKLNAYAYTQNFYGKPRITWEQLVKHSSGLICTTACLGGELAQMYFRDKKKTAAIQEHVYKYSTLFGSDFYIELQAVNLPEQARYNEFAVLLSRIYNIKTIITTDAHYVNREDAGVHDTMLCMQVNKKKGDSERFRFPTNDFYLKSGEEIKREMYTTIEMRTLLDSLKNTVELTDKCNAEIELDRHLLPKFPGLTKDAETVLAEHCNEGYKRRFGKQKRPDVVERVKYELKVIREKGYADYFLIVEDFINWAKEQGIYVGGGRGSGAGSEVSYLLGITEIEPIQYGLLFERFLNPERITAPDIDTDFCYERRGEVVEYVRNKYGREHVCCIIAKGKLTAKAVCRRVLTAYGFEMVVINKVSKTIPDDVGTTLADAYRKSPEFRIFCDDNVEIWKEMQELEGMISHVSTHAAGIVISSEPLRETIPCMSGSEDRTFLMSQFDKKEVEKVGLFKFDFLGLKTLTIERKAVENILRNKGVRVNLDEIDLHDPRLYDTMNGGMLKGIFQFSAPAGEQIIKRIRPTSFNDVIAAEALCRPGVLERDMYIDNKNACEEIDFGNDIVEEILGPTYGAIVYQEQTMLLMNRLAGWSLGKADKMRKVKDLEEYRAEFVDNCADRGYDRDFANSIYDRFDLGYSFNKSHAVSYAVNTMQTVWLKTYYPAEFMAATLTLELTAQEPEIKAMLKECRRMGIEVLPPDINKSTDEFLVEGNTIRLPLKLIAQAGKSACEEIMAKRPFASLQDFMGRIQKKQCNSRVVKNLVKAGCFETVEVLNRSALLKTIDKDCQDVYCKEVCRMYELEVLGMMLTDHPLNGVRSEEISDDGMMTMKVMLEDVKTIKDKSHKMMAFLKIETPVEFVEGVMFSHNYSRYGSYIKKGSVITVTGYKRDNSFIVERVN